MDYQPSELVGENSLDYVHPDDLAVANRLFGELMETPGATDRFEYRMRHADGSWRIVEGVAKNALENDAVEGIIIVSRDVTERRRRERQLERSNEKLDQFASVLSHDLRNPLNVIQVRSELAKETGEEEHIEQVIDSSERMETMIEKFLTLARHGQQIENPEPVQLQDVCTESWENVQTTDATLDLTLPKDVTVQADRDQLMNVFENLFRNASDHNDSPVTITVGLLADETGFFVADDGVGIPESERETIFEHGYSTSEAGTGFGLAIVEDIVEAHGWEITATESESGGARFEIATDTAHPTVPDKATS